MGLRRFRVTGVRNLVAQEVLPGPHLNLLVGENGSGKSSFLEALFLLGRGKSFRTSRMSEVIRVGESVLELFGEVAEREGGTDRIGVRKERGSTEVRINGEWEPRLSSLVRRFPLVVVTPRSHELLERGPEHRRRMVDWGVFHVEPGYNDLMARYQKVLAQRNEGLRRQPGLARVWDPELARVAEEVDARRSRFLVRLNPYLAEMCARLLPGVPTTIEWRRGWEVDRDLLDLLAADLPGDLRQGFTRQGPHRGDLLFQTTGGQPAVAALSRGQSKLLVLAVFTAQAALLRDLGHRPPSLLLDDLSSELDRTHQSKVLGLLHSLGLQTFITEKEPPSALPSDSMMQMFHVEQGRIMADE